MAVHISFEVAPAAGRPEELVGHARYVNESDKVISFVPIQVESASLALEIEDSSGSPVLLPPPPVPDPATQRFALVPSESYEVDYPGFLPSWTERGHYRVRARLVGQPPRDTVQSDWVDIDVMP